jgi:diacylglycerol kinase (ATP)
MMKELHRLYKAFGYSRDGLRAAWKDAGAFRTEIILTPFIIVAAVHFAQDRQSLALLIGSWLAVIVIELVNTGIEAVTDLAAQGKILPEAKKAKDASSAAVLAACVLCGMIWACVLL